ncbi:MAG: DUF4255 domain-containing protein [Bacteroidota bacterium]
MISNVLSVIADKLNDNLSNRFSQQGELVILSSLNELDKENNTELQNKLLLTVANIEQERSSHVSRTARKPINVYLYLLLSSNFQQGNYHEGLKLLSAAISFFQYTATLNHQNSPDLGDSIEKLVFEMVNLNIQELSQIWGIHGGKYLPSVLYKARMVTISEDILEGSFDVVGLGSDVS